MNEQKVGHQLQLVQREKLTVTGVTHLGNFDDREISLSTASGTLTLKGEGLNITHLDVERGNLHVSGLITSMQYSDQGISSRSRRSNLWQRLLK
ncbi:MAG: sporulation protein YabP [Syntrophomonadaceae bacterium]|jgi:sporulation protein YabP|nr:sporulation protein YabP [Syntrophomonadaceae bacterium]